MTFPIHLYFNKFFRLNLIRKFIDVLFQLLDNLFFSFSLMLTTIKSYILSNQITGLNFSAASPKFRRLHLFSSFLTLSSAILKLASQCAGPIDSLVSITLAPISKEKKKSQPPSREPKETRSSEHSIGIHVCLLKNNNNQM